MSARFPVDSLTVYEEDDETVLFEVSTDPAHQAPFLKAFDNYPEQEIDFVKGSASIGQQNVRIVDAPTEVLDQTTGFVTSKLAEPGEGSQILGHRAVTKQDVGTGPGVVLDGVVKSVQLMDTYSGYELELRDIRERERKTKAFQRTTTPTVLPYGVLNGYGIQIPILATSTIYPIAPTSPIRARFLSGGPNEGVIEFGGTVRRHTKERTLTAAMREALGSVSRLASAPDVVLHDRWRLLWRDTSSGGVYSTIRQVALTHPDRVVEGPSYHESGGKISAIYANNFVSGDTLPSNGQLIDVIVQYDGPVTPDWPYHIQGITLGEFIRNGYRGDYSDRDPRMRYDEDALLALKTPVRAKIEEPVDDLRAFFEEHAYPVGHAVPALNSSGEISPVTYLLPDATVSVPTLSDSNCRPAGGGWSHGTEDAVNIVRVTYKRDFLRDGVPAETEVPIERQLDLSMALLGEQELEISGLLLRSIGNKEGDPLFGDTTDEIGAEVSARVIQMVLDRFPLGGQYFALEGRRTDSDVEDLKLGDYVVVGVSWHPDYESGQRGANRLAQVLSRRDLDAAWTSLTLIDAGTANAPVGQPTLGVVTIDANGMASVPVTALATGSKARIEYAVNPTEPPSDSSLWRFRRHVEHVPLTFFMPPIPPGATMWVRARGEAVGRRPSAYTTPVSVTASTVPRILGAGLELDNAAIPTVTWIANQYTAGVRFYYAVHDEDATPAAPTNEIEVDASDNIYEFSSLRVPAGKAMTLWLEPWTGWTGSAVSGSAGAKFGRRVVGELEPIAPWVQAEFERDAEAETATLTLSVRDPHGTITAIEHSKREGSQSGDAFSAYSATWDSAPSTPPYDGTYSVSLSVPGGEESAIRWRITFVDIAGVERTIGSTHYTSQIDEHEAQIRVFFAGGVLMDNDSENAPDDSELQDGVIQPTTLAFPVWVRNELHLREGAEVTALRGRVYNEDGPGGGTHDSVVVSFQVKSNTGGAGSSQQANSVAGGWQTVENLLISKVIDATESYFIDATVRSDDDLTHARAIWGEVDVIRHTTQEM